jgi:hypothetical protein
MSNFYKIIILLVLPALSFGFCLNAIAETSNTSILSNTTAVKETLYINDGISFSCNLRRLNHIKLGMENYLNTFGISKSLVVEKIDSLNNVLTFTLNTPKEDSDTLQLKFRPEYAIRNSIVQLPTKNGEMKNVETVSKKEILIALLQHGRLTEFSGKSCDIQALKEQVNIRQNIVAWTENLDWNWPNGGSAKWNEKYWNKGTPLQNVKLYAAFNDIFRNYKKYAVGCYTATKIIMAQGVIDYYHRIKHNELERQLVEKHLASDHEPLIDVEPGEMWFFEKDFDPEKLKHPGKILKLQHNVATRNFVPGDWVYILNNDPKSSQKTGYEGSNAIYLGRNRFDDYYNDNNHFYTYEQKLDEVYQWRNGVFSRSRDSAKIKSLSKQDYEQQGKSPSEGGLVLNFRVFPISFSKFNS